MQGLEMDESMKKRQGTAWVVMGVSGCGKSETGSRLAAMLDVPFIEGDLFHSPANVAKMSAGQPLDDADRAGWLAALRDELSRACVGGGGVVLACSALKRVYRDLLRGADCDVRFVHLSGQRDVIAQRMSERSDHYMPTSLLDSQLRTLEPLHADEAGVTLDNAEPIAVLVDRVRDYAGIAATAG
jgi:gluconokinase